MIAIIGRNDNFMGLFFATFFYKNGVNEKNIAQSC